MHGSDLLLDTNAAIALLNQSPAIAERIGANTVLFVPLIVLGELEFGARNSANRESNLKAIEGLLKETTLLLPDRATASAYGDIQTQVRRKGRPIPTNDLWIAALGLQHGLRILTRDSHFLEVDGLAVVDW